MTNALCLRVGDDVANVLAPVSAGDALRVLPDSTPLTATGDLPQYHKIALRPLPKGHRVRRGGIVIGITTEDINTGAHVHVHNLRSLRARPARTEKETA